MWKQVAIETQINNTRIMEAFIFAFDPEIRTMKVVKMLTTIKKNLQNFRTYKLRENTSIGNLSHPAF